MSDQFIFGQVVFVLLLMVISAIFSGAETGVMAINRYKLEHAARKGNKSAQLLQRLLRRPDRLLGVIIIGNQLANNMAVATVNILAVSLFGQQGVIVATFILTIIILIFAEVMPKTFAAFYPDAVAYGCRWILQILLWILYPLVWIVNTIANGVLKTFGLKLDKANAGEPLGFEELKGLIGVGNNKLPQLHKHMLMGVLDLEQTTVNDVMIPRSEVYGLDLNQSWDKIISNLSKSEQAEVLVYENQIDNVKGILKISQVIGLIAKGAFNKSTLLQNLSQLHYVPEGVSLSKQLKAFQTVGYKMGIIVDEYGDICGLITLSDIIEEIIGQYNMEASSIQYFVRKIKTNVFEVDAGMNIRDFNRATGFDLPVDGPNTLRGIMLEHLEHLPTHYVGCRINDYGLDIISFKDGQIGSVKVMKLEH